MILMAGFLAIPELSEDKQVNTDTTSTQNKAKTKGFVTQILAGDKNLTLRSIADVADALGHSVDVGVAAGPDGRSASTSAW
jgi:hypothetical protein